MNVSLTPELERLVSEKVASGLYASASEVVREALRRMQQTERQNGDAWLEPPPVRARLRQALADADADVDAGRLADYDDASLTALAQDVQRRGQERQARGNTP